MSTMEKGKLRRIRKALVAAGAAAAAAFGAGLAEGGDWRAAAGMAAGAALIAGWATYAVPNKLSADELLQLAEKASRR